MKVNDGKIIELDPNKEYWFIIKASSGIMPNDIKMRNGQIVYVRKFDDIMFVENTGRIVDIVLENRKPIRPYNTLAEAVSIWRDGLIRGCTDPNCGDFKGFLLEEKRAGWITEELHDQLLKEYSDTN